jgi:hypothetical protein
MSFISIIIDPMQYVPSQNHRPDQAQHRKLNQELPLDLNRG